ncbi:putative xylosidase protein [Phaeoacremonium minimum UCRPA7]|uniref:Putative xylosidase protein n=1 Tax=Phaeoacremonium minimum (strain UCR-PA7) TaxID=1286976 RepID=R8BUG2_PHAM7|nr:putative xylosidase protein [Phaeoacremonium minimum UCRPA7]EOO03006.1 putative xylosidase protein [Phaeoacremonium minimum UCRPA7]
MLATGGLYAPTIRYHNDTFYVICTNCKRGDSYEKDGQDKSENFVVSCSDIWSNEWSDPVYFEFDGIDPSLFFEDGKAYVHASAAPGPWTKINLFEIDLSTGEKLSPEKTIWEGTGGVWPEGPHIYKKDGWYYLMIAEGGTHENHMVVMSRSRDIWGPYEACPNNPILTARGTNEYVQYTGHCDAFQDEQGQWWGVCLAVRKDTKGRYNMGRETFITHGTWNGDWLSFDTVKITPEDLAPPSTGIAVLTAAPSADLIYIRDPEIGRYSILDSGAEVALTASLINFTNPRLSPTFIGKRQRKLKGRSSATLRGSSVSQSAKFKAGIACYKDEHRFLRIFYDVSTSIVTSELRNNAKQIYKTESREVQGADSHITFRISYTEAEYRLEYTTQQDPDLPFTTMQVIDTLDMTGPDFVGPVIGVFAVAEAGEPVVEFAGFSVE